MAHERLRPTYTFDDDRLKALKKIAPEAFADGKINWETLKEALGDYLEDDAQEHFGLFWPGKREARRMASRPPEGTLAPVYGEGLKRDGTPDSDGYNDSQNVFIEGENLEVLKILQKAYAGRIKMIYIDPPYNTGNDFVYDDNFTEPLQEYLRRTGQTDEEGRPLTTNKRADGRFHSRWLSMMYPRLRLARNLLRDDGVIFVSIDDNEVHNLRALMNEIFGEENFIANVVWEKKYTRSNDAKWFSDNHDHIIVFGKKKEDVQLNLQERNAEQLKAYSNPDNHPKGIWKSTPLHAKSGSDTRPYTFKNGVVWRPPIGTFRRFSDHTMEILEKDDEIWFGHDQHQVPSRKSFLIDVKKGVTPITIWKYTEVGHNHEANEELKHLNLTGIFTNPKPTRLVKRMIELCSDEDDIILDFFAGSSTTAHAIIEANQKQNMNRKFILVQIPDKCDDHSEAIKSGFKNLSEIGKERVRRVCLKAKESQTNQSEDIGFSVFRLTDSNFIQWQNYADKNTDQLESLFEYHLETIKKDREYDSLICEIYLIEGFPLHSTITKESSYRNNAIKRVTSDFHAHSLLLCFDEEIKPETIRQLDLGENDIFICLDSAITDQDKLRLSDKGLIKTI